MTFRVRYERDSHKGGKDYATVPIEAVSSEYLNNVIRYNINNGTYEIKVGRQVIVLDVNKDSASYMVNVLVKYGIPLSYLQACENEPLKWFDFMLKNPAPANRDHMEIVYRKGGPSRSPYLPAKYYRLRMEITEKLFSDIMKGTDHFKAYAFGKSLFYERKAPNGNIIVLEKWELTSAPTPSRHFYLYPHDVDIETLVVPRPKHVITFEEVVKNIERSYGASEWLVRVMETGDWERVETTILARNMFLSEDQIKTIMAEFSKRYNTPIRLSDKFTREYAKWRTRS